MKIGIVTFHASLNCGSMLQAYALQEILREKYNQDVEIINFSSKGQRQMYSLIDTRLRPRVIKRNLRILPYIQDFRIQKKDYKKFMDEYFLLTPKEYRKNKELFELEERYDILVAGGDQVWNIMCRDFDLAYFLNFSNSAKKVSFSPSLGAVNINKATKKKQIYKMYLEKFDYISVREPNGKKWLEELLDKEVNIIADPTILLTSDEWIKKIKTEPIKESYIFYYAFNYSNNELNNALQRIAKKLKTKIYVFDRKEWNICHLNKFGIELYPTCGPVAFLSLMKSAQFIVTDSFHGTVFSILFNKKFANCKHDVNQDKDDDRSSSLLAELSLSNRYVLANQITEKNLLQEIDYTVVNEKTENLRKKAFSYISQFLGEEL